MKQRILALLLALCMLMPLTALADTSPTLPDLGKFAGDHLTQGNTEDFGFCQRVTLYGTKENVKLVAEAYVERLLKKYDICKHAHFSNFYDGGQSRHHYALGYTGDAKVGTVGYADENEGWQISAASIILTYSQYSSDNYVQLTYCSEFNYTDTGDRLQASTLQNIPAAAPTPKSGADAESRSVQTIDTPSASICTVCSGTGAYNAICSTCGGGGVITHPCSTCNGDRKNSCSSCSGNGYSQCGACSGHGTRNCSSCGGTGHHSSSSHHGSSHHSSNSSKCSTCGGDGKRSCSSCSGDGRQNCSTCFGSGERWCGSCNGSGGRRTTCTVCSGDGHYISNCNSCNGTGILK